jgi:hypothetical protein
MRFGPAPQVGKRPEYCHAVNLATMLLSIIV